MADREKVIKALELEVKYPHTWGCEPQCPYYGNTECTCYTQVAIDALELLKGYEYAQCRNCQFRNFGENEVDSWDRCTLHGHHTSPDEYCSWFVERAGEVG